MADSIATLKNRADFLRLRNGRVARSAGFMVQAMPQETTQTAPSVIRAGYTASKKVGNAVHRNRAKRRLRALVGEHLATHGQKGWDYVLIARAEATEKRPFEKLERDFKRMLGDIHRVETKPRS